MSSVNGFVEPFLRIYQLAEIIGRYGLLIALVIGIIGWFYSSRDPRSMARYRGMAVGGASGFVAIVALDVIYDVLVFILGTQFLPAGWPYGAISGSEATSFTDLAAALSIALEAFGLTIFIIGVTWWAFGNRDSLADARGRRGIVIGLTLIGASIGGNVFSTLAWILL
jgi:cbb3-type cytochrome oxidase subunit 3